MSRNGKDQRVDNWTEDSVLTCPSIVHSLSFQTLLELGAHESISISRVLEDHEVDLEDSHVDSDGKDDEA